MINKFYFYLSPAERVMDDSVHLFTDVVSPSVYFFEETAN